MAEFRQRKRNVSRTGLVFKKEKRKGLSEAKTELIMAQLREMYPDQFVNKYPINKSKDEWAPMISVLGENLELFEKRRKEEYLETDMSQFIPPTTEKIIAPLLSGSSNRYYTIFGEGRTELLLRSPEALIDISWKQTYPAEGFDEVFRLNIMEGGKSVNLTLSPFESRLQRTEVRGIIERIKKTRPVEYSLRQNDAYGIMNSIETMSGSKVMVSYNPTDQTLSFSGGEESISVSTSANARGKHKVSESMGIYSKKQLLNVFRSFLASDYVSSGFISFDSDKMLTMRFNASESAQGYVKYPIREIEQMNKEEQQKANEAKAQGEVFIMIAPADANGKHESLPLSSLNAKKQKIKR